MNNIFVDLSTLKEDEIKMACYGIKMFHHKKKNLSIVICGNKENMLTISSLPGVEIIDTSKKEENKEKNDEDIRKIVCFQIILKIIPI